MSNRYLEVTYRKGKPLAAYFYLPRRSGDVSVRFGPGRHPGLLVDWTEDGRPIGIEMPSPSLVTVEGFNQVLTRSSTSIPSCPRKSGLSLPRDDQRIVSMNTSKLFLTGMMVALTWSVELSSRRDPPASRVGPSAGAPGPASGSWSKPGMARRGPATGPGGAFTVDDPRLARVSPDGVVIPLGNGPVTLTAKVGNKTAQATISVEDFDLDSSWSFRNHVEPVLTRHGLQRGGLPRRRGRQERPAADPARLRPESRLRRARPARPWAGGSSASAPAESLLLLKPTRRARARRRRQVLARFASTTA